MTESPRYAPRSAWTMTLLLTALALINFLDKVVLGMIAVPLMADLHLSPQQFGLIAGSFFWLFSTSTILVGLLSNRMRTRWLLLVMGVSWAVMQLPQALTTSASALLACRVILGAAEGPSFPTSVHALFKWFPDSKRGLPVAVVNQGAVFGLLVAGLAIPAITRAWGWRSNFLVLAAIGAAWSVLWLCLGREGSIGAHPRSDHDAAQPAAPGERLSYWRIMADPSVLSILLLGFAAYWALGQGIAWLPTYLEKGVGFSSLESGRWFAVIIGTASPVNIGLSWMSQKWIERGIGPRRARVQLVAGAFIASSAMFALLLLVALSPLQKVTLYAIAAALPTLCFSLAPPLLAQVVPESRRGALMAIQTAISSLGAAIAPIVMGHLVQTRSASAAHAYELGFALGAVLLIVAALAALCWLHPERSRLALNPLASAATV
ncbi:MFS transporter [Paraburkholderia sp. J67]|uniref:MFS transporter n=1 Tax=Paraburkholderia sp. J67 TaxID=2805435 RepID=UPI002ABE5671|nr:MFS transporter [Paraburkholderia sp. J67]